MDACTHQVLGHIPYKLCAKMVNGSRHRIIICRLCTSTDFLVDIFQGEQDTIPPYLMANILLGMDINPNEGSDLPRFICQGCNNTLKNFYNFKTSCLEVERKLRGNNKQEIFKENKNETFDNGEYHGMSTYDYEEYYVKPDETLNNTGLKNEVADINNDESQNSENVKVHYLIGKKEERKEKKVLDKNNYKKKKQFQCHACGIFVKSAKTLKSHILVSHYGHKRYSCPECSRRFTRLEQKKIHQRSHLGIKPFVCDLCGKSSTKKQDLIRHMKVHSQEKKYQCPYCSKTFKWSNGFACHMRSHTGERPYTCNECDKSYKCHNGLAKHRKKFHVGLL